MESPERQQDEALQHIGEWLAEGEHGLITDTFQQLHPAEVARALTALPPDLRRQAWQLVEAEQHGDVLLYVNDEVREGLIQHMEPEALVAATEGLDTDDLADILPDLPETVITELLRSMDAQDRQRLEAVLQYPEDTAGGMMNVDTVTVRPDVSLDVVLRYLRSRGKLPEATDNLIVVNRDDQFLGLLAINDILVNDLDLTVAEIFNGDARAIDALTPAREVARMFEERDLISAPVVNAEGRLVGRITIDDAVDVIRSEADHSILSLAGLDEEDDMFAPVVRSTRRRSLWLGVNLITALLASWVIGQFGATIEKMVALAVLMPVVASMGGIAGSQTLTLVIRGIAVGQISQANARKLLRKELLVGALNGLLWAVVVGSLAFAWFQNGQLGVIIGLAILFNLVAAALAGALVPQLLKRYGADPALAGGVVLTTITDVVGFFAFLGLAALFLV